MASSIFFFFSSLSFEAESPTDPSANHWLRLASTGQGSPCVCLTSAEIQTSSVMPSLFYLGSGAQTQVVGRAYQIVLLAEPANPDQEIFINPQLYCGKKVEYLVWWHPCTASMWQETTLRLRNTWAIYTLSRKLKHPWVSYPTHCSEEEVASLIWVQWRGCTRKWNFTLKRILSHRTGYIFFFSFLLASSPALQFSRILTAVPALAGLRIQSRNSVQMLVAPHSLPALAAQ